MNTSQEKWVDPRVEYAAAHVAKLFSGNMSDDDIRRLEDWLSDDPRNRDEYETILELWDLVEKFDADPVDDLSVQSPIRLWFSKPQARLVASVFAVLIVFSTVFFSGDVWIELTKSVAHYDTAVGERRVVELSDGSTITMNTGSSIEVDFARNERHLKLQYGEAFFDIEKDRLRPFVIEFGARQITVLGTQFNIYISGSVATVAVVEGLVRVDRGSDTDDNPGAGFVDPSPPYLPTENSEVYIEAGKTAVFSVHDEDSGSVVALDTKQFRDWRSGVVRFDNESLIKVIAELNRYSDRKVLIEDPNVVALKVSGVYQLDSIDTFLAGIDAGLPVSIVRYVDRYVIIGDSIER